MFPAMVYSFEIENGMRVQAIADSLVKVHSDVLEARITSYMARENVKPFREDDRLLALAPEHPAFQARGALVALARRHGEDYVGRILNERKPTGVWETIKAYATGKLPAVEQGHQFLMFS